MVHALPRVVPRASHYVWCRGRSTVCGVAGGSTACGAAGVPPRVMLRASHRMRYRGHGRCAARCCGRGGRRRDRRDRWFRRQGG